MKRERAIEKKKLKWIKIVNKYYKQNTPKQKQKRKKWLNKVT